MEQEQRISADPFVDERERQPVAAFARRHLPAVDRECVRRRCRGLRWPQTQVVVHGSESAALISRICLGSTIKWLDTLPIIWISTLRSVKYQPAPSWPKVSK